jgi:hypothetical protein
MEETKAITSASNATPVPLRFTGEVQEHRYDENSAISTEY